MQQRVNEWICIGCLKFNSGTNTQSNRLIFGRFLWNENFHSPSTSHSVSFCAEPKAKSQNPSSNKEPSTSRSTSFKIRSPQHRTVKRLERDGDNAQALQKCEELRPLRSLEMYRLKCECLRRKLAQVSWTVSFPSIFRWAVIIESSSLISMVLWWTPTRSKLRIFCKLYAEHGDRIQSLVIESTPERGDC